MHSEPMRRMGAIMRTSAVAAVAVVTAACVGAVGTPTISIGEMATDAPSPTASTTGPGTSQVPDGFPLMPGMRADDALPGAPGLIGRWTSASNGAEVYAFLETALPKAGYRVDLLAPGDTVAVIRFTPPDGQQLQIDLGQEGSGTFMELRLPRD
jgi:hypothetical protein